MPSRRERRAEASWGELIEPTAIDRLVDWFSPTRGLARLHARVALRATYRAAQPSRRRRGGPGKTSGGSSDDHASRFDLWQMREECRELERDNCIADGLLTRFVENVIGLGITPQAKSADDGWNQAAEDWWAEYFRPGAGGDVMRVEATGRLSGWQMLCIIVRSLMRDGDVGVILKDTGQAQAVEADQIGTPTAKLYQEATRNQPTGRIFNGVEMDKIGRPIRYWVGDPLGKQSPFLKDGEPIEARNFIHVFDPTRFTQTRGVPAFHAVITLFDQLDEYIEAELVGAKISAMLTAFISQRNADIAAMNRAEADEDSEGNALYYERLRTGAILYGEPGEGVDIIGGNRPNQNFPEFMLLMFRMVGMNLGLPLELVALDFSKTNYSSARAALLQAYRTFQRYQKIVVEQVLNRLWRWRIGQAIKTNELTRVGNALNVEWILPGWAWVDPLDEIRANALAVDRGFKTLADVAAEQGKDWQRILEQRKREIAFAIDMANDLSKGDETVTWRDVIGFGRLQAADTGKGAEIKRAVA